MNAQAAKEILDLIMLDDVVARRAALDVWTRRWVATLHVQANASVPPTPAMYRAMARELRGQILSGITDPNIHALQWGTVMNDPTSLVCVMHVVLQEPRDENEGEDAAKRMMEMAKGERS